MIALLLGIILYAVLFIAGISLVQALSFVTFKVFEHTNSNKLDSIIKKSIDDYYTPQKIKELQAKYIKGE